MKKSHSDPTAKLYAATRIILGLLFLFAGGTKISDPYAFAETIDAFGMLPADLVFPLALALPPVEILAGIGLLLDLRGSLAVITTLLMGFILVLAAAISMGLDIDCGCYGPGDPEAEIFSSLWTSLYRDLAMTAGAGFLYWYRFSRSVRPRRIGNLLFILPNHQKESQCIR